MHDLHIIDFCKDAAKALLSLYKHFPIKTILYVEDISGTDTPDEFGLHSRRHNSCFSTLIWLAEAGYISYSQPVKQEAIEEAVLTVKAFTYLTAPIEAGGQTRINELELTLKNKSSDELQALLLKTFKDGER